MAKKLSGLGHDVRVLAATEPGESELWNEATEHGFRIYRVKMPRGHTLPAHERQSGLRKLLWHVQDHFDPRNRWILRRVLKDMRPDHVKIHVLTGLGYNMLKELGARKLPVTYVLHDLGLACMKTTMFNNGHACVGQCGRCKGSSRVKNGFLARIRDLGFISPSIANMAKVAQFLPAVARARMQIIHNMPDELPPLPAYKPDPKGKVRILYAGRLHVTKGIDVMLKALAPLAGHYDFDVLVLGRGDAEASLMRDFGTAPWVTFGGFVTTDDVLNRITASDMLCVPSVWPENYSRSVIQALCLGTPVIGSDIGGIPEQVEHEVTGLLLPPGDVEAWRAAFERLLKDPAFLKRLRVNATRKAPEYQAGDILEKYIKFMQREAA
jgi:glycosyltransferase involved in cell wall biosynthesis